MGKSWKNPLKIATAQKKGQIFTKFAREISVSARIGGPDPSSNARLKLAIQAARALSCPKDTIERAIKKGSGQLEGSHIEEITYEGYGPQQVGVIVECQTDNKNRSVSTLRSIFKKNDGSLGNSGSVSWMFHRMCLVEGKNDNIQDPEEEAIEAGASDVETKNDIDHTYSFYGAPTDLDTIRNTLMERGWSITVAELSYRPKNFTEVDDEKKTQVYNFLEALEDNEDSHKIYATIE